MKRQKLDVEQTIETLKKSLCKETIALAQQNGRHHATKAASFAKTLKQKDVLYYEERLQNEYKTLLNWQCIFWVYSITFPCFSKQHNSFLLMWLFDLKLHKLVLKIDKKAANPQTQNWGISTSLKLFVWNFWNFVWSYIFRKEKHCWKLFLKKTHF